MIDADGVVHGVGQLPDDAHLAVGIGGGGEAHGLEIVDGDGLATAERHEQSAGPDGFHSTLVDAAIAFKPLLKAAMVFGKGGWVEDDEVEGSGGVEVFQHVGHHTLVAVGRAEVELHIAVAEGDGFFRYVHSLHVFSTPAEGGQREPTSVAEAVQHTAASSQLFDQPAVFALVDEEARFLPFEEVDEETVAVFGNLPFGRLNAPQVAVGAAAGHSGAAFVEHRLEALVAQ